MSIFVAWKKCYSWLDMGGLDLYVIHRYNYFIFLWGAVEKILNSFHSMEWGKNCYFCKSVPLQILHCTQVIVQHKIFVKFGAVQSSELVEGWWCGSAMKQAGCSQNSWKKWPSKSDLVSVAGVHKNCYLVKTTLENTGHIVSDRKILAIFSQTGKY